MKRMLPRLFLACPALTVGLLSGESGARLILNPPDFVSVKAIRDDVLGTPIAAGTWGLIGKVFETHTGPTSATSRQSAPCRPDPNFQLLQARGVKLGHAGSSAVSTWTTTLNARFSWVPRPASSSGSSPDLDA
jgi:hypothetical protein